MDFRDTHQGVDVLSVALLIGGDLGEACFVFALHGDNQLNGFGEGFVSLGEPVQALVNSWFAIFVVRHGGDAEGDALTIERSKSRYF